MASTPSGSVDSGPIGISTMSPSNAPVLLGFVPAIFVIALLVSRLLGSLAAAWAIGLTGLLYVLAFGRPSERILILGLGFLSIIAGGESTYFGFRTLLFIGMFMFISRYTRINPWFHLIAQSIAFSIAALGISDVLKELFLFAPSIILLIMSTDLKRNPATASSVGGKLISPILNISSLLTTGIGLGTRSALFVWLMSNLRKLSLSNIFFLGLIGIFLFSIAFTLRDLPIIQKLAFSFREVAEPIDLETGGVSQRAIENLMFLGYANTASARELLIGSTEMMWLDGEILGYDKDLPFAPHNQLFGMLFQYGILGTILFFVYLYNLVKYFYIDRYSAYILVLMWIPGLILKAGVFDADLALLAGTLNWLRYRHVLRLERINLEMKSQIDG